MWNGEVKRSARLRQGGFVDAKSGDLHSSPCRPYMVLRSKRGGSDQTTYMFPCLSKCLNLDVYWAVKTQPVRHTAYWISPPPPLPFPSLGVYYGALKALQARAEQIFAVGHSSHAQTDKCNARHVKRTHIFLLLFTLSL